MDIFAERATGVAPFCVAVFAPWVRACAAGALFGRDWMLSSTWVLKVGLATLRMPAGPSGPKVEGEARLGRPEVKTAILDLFNAIRNLFLHCFVSVPLRGVVARCWCGVGGHDKKLPKHTSNRTSATHVLWGLCHPFWRVVLKPTPLFLKPRFLSYVA